MYRKTKRFRESKTGDKVIKSRIYCDGIIELSLADEEEERGNGSGGGNEESSKIVLHRFLEQKECAKHTAKWNFNDKGINRNNLMTAYTAYNAHTHSIQRLFLPNLRFFFFCR